MSVPETVVVARFTYRHEAEFAGGFLSDAGIPNSVLVHSTVKNYTLRDQLYRIRVQVGVVYAADMKIVRDAMRPAAAGIGNPVVGSTRHAGLILRCNHGCDDPTNNNQHN